VLRLRRTRKDESEVRAAEAHRAVVAADSKVALRLAELRAAPPSPGITSVAEFRVRTTDRGHRAAAVQAASHAALAARALHRQRIEELVQASKAVAALERLEARVAAQQQEAEQRAEAREIDDLVTARRRRPRP
jgi:hypothetical protein